MQFIHAFFMKAIFVSVMQLTNVWLQQAASSLVALVCAETWAADGKPTTGMRLWHPPATARALPQLLPPHRLEDPIDNRKIVFLSLCWL
jgi:hypothetical protein